MCGISGYIDFDKVKNDELKYFITQAIHASTLRGGHSTGIFMVPKDKEHKDFNEEVVYKKAIAGHDFIGLPRYNFLYDSMDKYKFVIAHNRFATVKSLITDSNSHPFKSEHITLVHNGHVTSLYDLDVPKHHTIEVDSEVVTQAIALHGYYKTLQKIKGAAALVWYDSKEDVLRFYRNKDRPLYFATVKKSNAALIASEIEMVQWLAWRNGLEIKKEFYVEPETVVTFSDDVHKFKVEKIEPIPNVVSAIFNRGRPSHSAGNNWHSSKSTKEVLEELNKKIGDDIKFSMEGIDFNQPKSRHGTIKGRLLEKPYSEIAARGIPRDKFKGDKLLKGKIAGIEYIAQYLLHIVVVDNVVETTEEDTSHSLVSQRDTEPVFEDSILGPEINHHKTAFALGPNGFLVEQTHFENLVKDGCASCTCSITPNMAPKLKWTAAKQPICWECQDVPGVNEYVQ